MGETYRLLIKEKIMISDVAANNSYSVIQYYSSLLVLRVYSRRPYTVKKKVREFPVSSRDVTTKLSMGGNNDVLTELFLPWGSLVSDIPAGDGKLLNLFLWRNFDRIFMKIFFYSIILLGEPP